MAKVVCAGAVGLVAVSALLWAALSPTNVAPPPPLPVETPAAPASLEYRGLAIQVASGWRPLETYGPLLEQIADLGANTVLLSVDGQMEHAGSQSIYIDARKVPAAEDFKAIIRRARELGLKPIVMPKVLLRNPRGSEWRGLIEPPDWDDWWEQYTEFVLYFADICREAGAEGLCVGSELISTEKYRDRWVTLIEQIRPRFWGGKLGYSANWDHYEAVGFWDKLDFIGMTTYYTLADEPNPTVEQIVERWAPYKEKILGWQRKYNKPLVLTEVGWCSQEGAAKNPWNYYQNQKATPEGHEEQRRLYEAFLRVWGDVPQLGGVIWWEWSDSPGGEQDFKYTPKGKPAEQLLRAWFKAGPPVATTQPAPPVSAAGS
ncbi:MAG: hypothetical protein AB1716_12635 [Planctomycetota bacterium]